MDRSERKKLEHLRASCRVTPLAKIDTRSDGEFIASFAARCVVVVRVGRDHLSLMTRRQGAGRARCRQDSGEENRGTCSLGAAPMGVVALWSLWWVGL